MNTVRIPLSLVEDNMKVIDLHGEIDVLSSHEHSNLIKNWWFHLSPHKEYGGESYDNGYTILSTPLLP